MLLAKSPYLQKKERAFLLLIAPLFKSYRQHHGNGSFF